MARHIISANDIISIYLYMKIEHTYYQKFMGTSHFFDFPCCGNIVLLLSVDGMVLVVVMKGCDMADAIILMHHGQRKAVDRFGV